MVHIRSLEGVIADISFQHGSQGIKVARGSHYPDIVRGSLVRLWPLSPATPFPFSLFALSPFISPPPLASYPSWKHSRALSCPTRNSLSEFLACFANILSQIHFAVGEFPLVRPWNRDEKRGLPSNSEQNFFPFVFFSFFVLKVESRTFEKLSLGDGVLLFDLGNLNKFYFLQVFFRRFLILLFMFIMDIIYRFIYWTCIDP